jgi:hypothetical protein
MGRRALSPVLALGLVVGGLGAAHARSATTVAYPIADVWPSLVRFLRVDRGYPIQEKDEVSGYILFDLIDGKKAYKASIELVGSGAESERESTKIIVTIHDLPRHFELTLLDKLAAKINEDRGPPPPARTRRPPGGSAPHDAGSQPRSPNPKELPR